MSQNDYPTDSLPVEQRQQIDRLADQFERNSRPANSRESKTTSRQLPELRSHLLKELITVEVELRRAAGQQPQAEDYRQRFPDEQEIIEAVFQPKSRRQHHRLTRRCRTIRTPRTNLAQTDWSLRNSTPTW